MTLWDRLRRFWTRRALTLNDPALRGLWQDAATATGVVVTEQTALRFAAVWACVRVISEDVATVPLILYRRLAGGGKERAPDRKLYRLLHDEPNPEMSSSTFRETLQAHILTWGNGYAEIERNGLNEPVALWPLDPSRVTPDRTRTDGRLIYRLRRPNTTADIILTPNEVLHIPGLGFDGIRGYSPIRMSAQAIGLGLAVEEFVARFYGQGFHLGGFIKHPKELAEPTYQRLKADMNDEKGLARSHLWKILEEGMEAIPLETKLKDSELTATRKQQVLDVARVYRVPPHKIMDLDRATFSNIEEQSIDYVVSTLRPWLVRWEQEINRKLVPSLERRLFFAEHLIDGLLRGNAEARSNALQTQFQNGALTIDEWREIENRNPVPDGLGKKHFVQLNMTTVDQAGKPKSEPTPLASVQSPPVPEPEEDNDEDNNRALGFVREAIQKIEALTGEVRAALKPSTPVQPVVEQDKKPEPPSSIPQPDLADESAQPTIMLGERAALRGLFVDALGRMVRRECKAIRKRVRRSKTREELLAWSKRYYADQAALVAESLRPAVASYLAARRSDRDVTSEARSLATVYVDEAQDELAKAGDVEPLLVRWEQTRAEKVADIITRGNADAAK